MRASTFVFSNFIGPMMKNNLISFSKATGTFVATGACFVLALYLGSLVTIFAR